MRCAIFLLAHEVSGRSMRVLAHFLYASHVYTALQSCPSGVIPGRWQVGFADLPASPESTTPGGMVDALCRNCRPCGYGFRSPLAMLAARNDGAEQFVTHQRVPRLMEGDKCTNDASAT